MSTSITSIRAYLTDTRWIRPLIWLTSPLFRVNPAITLAALELLDIGLASQEASYSEIFSAKITDVNFYGFYLCLFIGVIGHPPRMNVQGEIADRIVAMGLLELAGRRPHAPA